MKKTDCFVLDANTFISAFLLSPKSPSAQAYYQVISKGKIVVSVDTFNEFSDVFIRPKFDKYLSLSKRLTIIEDLKALVKFTHVTVSIDACRDPKDNKYLELAVSSGANCIISGDKDLLVLNPFEGIRILSPSEFLSTF